MRRDHGAFLADQATAFRQIRASVTTESATSVRTSGNTVSPAVLRTVDTMTTTFIALRTRLRAILRILEAEGAMNILLSTEGYEARADDCAGMRAAWSEVLRSNKKARSAGL
jgi:hypothetical protein